MGASRPCPTELDRSRSPPAVTPPRAYLAARPLDMPHHLAQSEGVAWMKAALQRAAGAPGGPGADDVARAVRLYDVVARQSRIDARATALADYTHADWDAMRVHAPSDGAGGAQPWHRAPLEARTAVFAETALAAARQAFADDAEPPHALAQVSCTGYDSPTAVQRVLVEKGWQGAGTRVLHVGHMGCYAAVPTAATLADLVSAEAGRTGAAVHGAAVLVELCTLHHDPATTDVERIVQQCLFADGAARMDVSSEPIGGGFALLDHAEVVIPGTLDEMTWRAVGPAFRMTLSREVPQHIREHIAPAMRRFLESNGLAVGDVDVFAVHPGGPRVIESTADALDLPDGAVRHSQEVLRTRGNMSSTTLPHIWAAIAADAAVPEGALVASVAFGPGLTVAMNLLRKGA